MPQAAEAPQTARRELTDILICAVMNGPATVIIIDPDGTIEYANQTYCAQTGHALFEVFGQKAQMLTSGLLPEHTYKALWAKLKKGEAWSGELQGVKKDGEPFWEQASISPIRDDQGRVRHYLKIAEDITERKRLETELRATVETLQMHEAYLQSACRQLEANAKALKKNKTKLQRLSQEDALTGLLNRRGLEAELRRAKALAERQGHGIGFLIIDIDFFKEINDRYGHAAGDRVLKECAALLRNHLRASDLICRYGGDELLIALPAADDETTRATALRILTAVRTHAFLKKGAAAVPVTVSIGAACGLPIEGTTLESIMKMADRALYQVKRSGRNGMALWPSGNPPNAEEDDFSAASSGAHSQPFRYVFRMLIAMLDAREIATGDHSRRVAQLVNALAHAMNLPSAQIALATQGALLHDIGKIAIPDTILLKPGRLTAAEMEIVKKHPQTGHDILLTNPEFKGLAEIVLSHQERFDGSGYPRGLKGTEIGLCARIFAVADAYEAIRAGRPYAPARSPEKALQEILRGRGTQFDPDVVDTLVTCQAQLEAVLSADPAPGH